VQFGEQGNGVAINAGALHDFRVAHAALDQTQGVIERMGRVGGHTLGGGGGAGRGAPFVGCADREFERIQFRASASDLMA